MKNVLSSLDPPGSVLSCPSTPISWRLRGSTTKKKPVVLKFLELRSGKGFCLLLIDKARAKDKTYI